MEREELLYWSNKHDDQFDDGIQKERKIGAELRKTKEVTKTHLVDIIKWKFEGDARRIKRESNLVSDIDEQVLRKVSNIVFDLDVSQDMYRIKLLCALGHGIGPAVASTILTFYDPVNYGVFDFHVWKEVFREELEGNYTVSNYIKLLSKLREVADRYGLHVRTVEKAYFKKNYEKSQRRRQVAEECSKEQANGSV